MINKENLNVSGKFEKGSTLCQTKIPGTSKNSEVNKKKKVRTNKKKYKKKVKVQIMWKK